ncbi:MAG: UDP-3-O-acyl-N-acetylglucosamine deacetylase [Spirochaetes bacterium]|nr:UDP-3-O-acyl-N-acetylglucosamine deacetylase [Spirochaetota bacterium]
MNMFQKTIKKIISFYGIGLHTGKQVTLSFHPAPAGSGIIFEIQNNKIELSISNIPKTLRSISIGKSSNTIMTIEHLAASLYMLGITNLIIRIDGTEIPALDGSALSFVKLLKKAHPLIQNSPIQPLFISHIIKIEEKDRFIIALPSHELKITYHINFPHPSLRHRVIHFNHIDEKVFIKKIAPARTFGFLNEVDSLIKKGLALGGDLNNAVVLADTGYVNKKLRFKDECIRHKVLDFIGALALLNRPVRGHFIVYRSGHDLDIRFIKKLKQDKKVDK